MSIRHRIQPWIALDITETKTAPWILDLGSRAGGAAVGYYRAGWNVVGVDIRPQPHYPFRLFVADMIWMLSGDLRRMGYNFAAIHASPPCQAFTAFQASQPHRVNRHPDLITPLRPLLKASGLPYVIENVPGAPLIDPVQFCGTAFGLGVERGQLWRHRLFETNWPLVGTDCSHDGRPAVMVAGHGRDGYRGSGLNAAEAREAMQIDWMNRDEMAEAVPPAYTENIGKQLLSFVRRQSEALAV